MGRRKDQPGFVVPYFMLPAFEKMGPEATGRFILAMGYYSQSGVVPNFGDDVKAEMMWFTAQPWLDQNKEKYEESRLSKSYSGWCSSLHTAGKDYLKIPFEDWVTAREGYEAYCNTLVTPQSPLPFTDWLSENREHTKELLDVKLPWGDDT